MRRGRQKSDDGDGTERATAGTTGTHPFWDLLETVAHTQNHPPQGPGSWRIRHQFSQLIPGQVLFWDELMAGLECGTRGSSRTCSELPQPENRPPVERFRQPGARPGRSTVTFGWAGDAARCVTQPVSALCLTPHIIRPEDLSPVLPPPPSLPSFLLPFPSLPSFLPSFCKHRWCISASPGLMLGTRSKGINKSSPLPLAVQPGGNSRDHLPCPWRGRRHPEQLINGFKWFLYRHFYFLKQGPGPELGVAIRGLACVGEEVG